MRKRCRHGGTVTVQKDWWLTLQSVCLTCYCPQLHSAWYSVGCQGAERCLLRPSTPSPQSTRLSAVECGKYERILPFVYGFSGSALQQINPCGA